MSLQQQLSELKTNIKFQIPEDVDYTTGANREDVLSVVHNIK